jgi:hypothetical protein
MNAPLRVVSGESDKIAALESKIIGLKRELHLARAAKREADARAQQAGTFAQYERLQRIEAEAARAILEKALRDAMR